jgi:ribonuclease P protein component
MKGSLKGSREFARLARKGRALSHTLLTVKVLPNGRSRNRCGLVVSKKVGNAVVRNKVKRRLREIIRAIPLKQGWDIMIIARSATSSSNYQELKAALEDILSRAGLRL